ncbi:hypothetical protein G9A89_019846 [Geosiphon pyriformis]|nr:hypothetical protein G9A89_019846 [Geosiphon pyriformis]
MLQVSKIPRLYQPLKVPKTGSVATSLRFVANIRKNFLKEACSETVVDDDGMPKEATWSVKALLPPISISNNLPDHTQNHEEIDTEQMKHLFRLCNLRVPQSSQQLNIIKTDINRLCHFVRHIQEVDVHDVPPMRSTWSDNLGVVFRPDDETFSFSEVEDEQAGRELLKRAKVTKGDYYLVEIGSSDKQ